MQQTSSCLLKIASLREAVGTALAGSLTISRNFSVHRGNIVNASAELVWETCKIKIIFAPIAVTGGKRGTCHLECQHVGENRTPIAH